MFTTSLENSRCFFCQQPNCDIQIAHCGCLLHSTCLSLDVLLYISSINNIVTCPSCNTKDPNSRVPIESMVLLPLNMERCEKAFRITPSTVHVASSQNKRCTTSKPTISRICRTGRWSPEESVLVDKLIESFDKGLLPLPQGMKLNEFLCDLLLCKTSRLTKKLKYQKLSSRSFKSSVGSCSIRKNLHEHASDFFLRAGASIQRAQTLFLRVISPSWLQKEVQLNISRVWRTQLANLCLQLGFHQLDTTKWLASLSEIIDIDDNDSLEVKRKRLKLTLSEDGDAYFNAGNIYSTKPMQENTTENFDARFEPDIINNLKSSDARGAGPKKTVFDEEESDLKESRHSESSISSLATLLTLPNISRRPSHQLPIGSLQCDSFDTNIIECATEVRDVEQVPEPQNEQNMLESVVEDSFTGGDEQGKFLSVVCRFLISLNYPFQHVDLWVPTERTDLEAVSKGKVCLSNAGHITVRSNSLSSGIIKQMQEFGLYSQSFAFFPGFGLPGRVSASGQPIWMNQLHRANPEHFSRADGAKTYGIRTAVGIPVRTSIGIIVVMLYSTSDLSFDARLVEHCMEYFRNLQPIPRWKLCVDIASDQTSISPGPALASHTPFAYIVPSSPVVSDTSVHAANFSNEQSLALLLGKYDALCQGDDFTRNVRSLRLLLLRQPYSRTSDETDQVNIILSKYQNYVRAKYSDRDIVRLITDDWKNAALTIVPLTDPSTQITAPSEDHQFRLESRVVSDQKFQIPESTLSPSPASFSKFDSM